ncbi:uncharacterized protein B0J16DRAFT_323115 [Fusarium flagelliforme]|uniref:BRCT domain-containing protein n=1 Tax=Fusarium flagelliforme TaxID=2675880 RepID=A0A395MVN0_9HYPO|nr:uncharacterized protein B0J16DRAFT_323115 [Fusarium flagelliforme]KAH7179635.1 hypothetical protein B0J16DRAFT_323115 [Fusarium flagelliforme]RFN51705.1 hypothetical protein FIE12Z_4017 [Fusarium flagelliforme]
MDSPPKRMTRARAAAKAGDSSVKTTKIVTAAARAKSSATASTKSTAAKRKTRADENDEEEEQREVAVRRTRGRPRKVEEQEAEAEAPAKPTRGRIVKKTATEAPKTTTTAAATAAKPTRGRPRKVVAAAPAEETAPAPVKKTTTTRTRTTASTTTTKPTTAARAAPKKSVKFQEPDKENIEPAVEAREPARPGIRGRPAKRGGATGSRTTRAAVRSAEPTDNKPLSPKKITQIPVSKDDESEDELAGDNPPVKPMMKSPIKPPSNTIKPQPEHIEEPAESTDAAESIINPPSLGAPVLRSPAKRQPASPNKDSLRSPARRIGAVPLPGSTMKKTQESDVQTGDGHSFKNSLLLSAAKRPQSPIKGLNFAASLQPQQSQSAMKASLLLSPPKRAMPGLKPVTEPRSRDVAALGEPPIMKPLVLGTPSRAPSTRPSDKLMSEEQAELDLDDAEEDVFNEPIENLEFPGRLSAVLPRHADPAWKKDMGIVDEAGEEITTLEEPQAEEEIVEDVEEAQEEAAVVEPEPITEAADLTEEEDSMVVDEEDVDEEIAEEKAVEADVAPQETETESSISAQSPVQEQNPMFQLREKDLEPQDMDSESDDENDAPAKAAPVTPTPFVRKTPKTSRASMGGFSALADRLDSWKASTPIKMAPLTSGKNKTSALPERVATPQSEASPASTHFFDDEMTVRAGMEDLQADKTAEIVEPDFDDMDVTEEDVELAQEANEMSLMEPDVLGEVVNTEAFDDTLSEASQEYGDENEAPVTPVRPVMKTFNTTTKVPLKPADDSSPTPLKKRSFSASRVAPKRPSGPSRSATVISYSPAKGRKSMPATIPESPSTPSTPAPVTPSKSDLWSSLGTPARTPRRDLNPSILRGAVVFVDVYTSEGADASSIFVELLTQMGARCMKSWNWNPSASGNEVTSSKVGITHVVFKDGSKRTLEKVRESNGIVQCVGVSWVLDCERLNDWVEESPYKTDISNVPRGGARRRKSMEPKALANMNGTLVTSPVKNSSRTAPSTPTNRRQSTQWMYTPSNQDEDEEMEDLEWSEAILTPVPKTPAPEAIARYAAELEPETPSAEDDDDDLDESPTKDALFTRTCPPKKSNNFRDMGSGIISQTKDDGVLMRLMAARRKSLQFAPKIGSPLARTWQ